MQEKYNMIRDGKQLPPTDTQLFRAYLDELVPTSYDMNQPDTPTSFKLLREESKSNVEIEETNRLGIKLNLDSPG